MLFSISNKTYDILKWVVGVVLPALAVLYGALAGVLSLPFPEKIPATIMALVLFLGAFLQANASAFAVRKGTPNNASAFLPKYPFTMSGPVYDTLKWLVQIILPAMSMAYLAMAEIWHLGFTEQVPAIIGAVIVFLGTVLQISSHNYRAAVRRVSYNTVS